MRNIVQKARTLYLLLRDRSTVRENLWLDLTHNKILKFLSYLQNFWRHCQFHYAIRNKHLFSVPSVRWLQGFPWLKYSECWVLCLWQSDAGFVYYVVLSQRYFCHRTPITDLRSVKLCNNLIVINYCVMRAYKVAELHSSSCSTPRHWSDVSGQSYVRVIVPGGSKVQRQFVLNTLRTGLLNCLNARSRGLTFRHLASCI